MDEENLNQEQEQLDLPEPSPIEKRAMDMGWRPKDQFNGEEDDFIDAKEFVRRQPLFEKIETQSKQIKSVTKALEALKTHYTRVEEAAVQKAIASLKAQRKQALADGDGDAFEVLDENIKNAEKQLVQIEQVREQPLVQEEVVNPEWQAWQTKNSWYSKSDAMRAYADKVGLDMAAKGATPSQVLVEVEKAVRKEFAHKFTNPNKEQAPDVDSSRQQARKVDKTGDDSWLSEQERKIMNDLVRSKVMTKEKYLADLKTAYGRK
jgi:hypothetical protein